MKETRISDAVFPSRCSVDSVVQDVALLTVPKKNAFKKARKKPDFAKRLDAPSNYKARPGKSAVDLLMEARDSYSY